MATFPRIPINPRLAFGESIEKVCPRGRLHPGLKELFTKAYFSAHHDECLIYDDCSSENNRLSSGAWILTILKFGQGDVAVRLSLKQRLETGRWIMPLQVPPAAPLWLIRHFLGRLKTPLIFCLTTGMSELDEFKKMWLVLSKDCHAAMYQYEFNLKSHHLIQTKIAQAMDEMQLEACLILISLITLIRNLSYEPVHGWIDKLAVKALIDYFVPALISRPYRPGYLTKDDMGCRNALCYLCHNLPAIQALCMRRATQNNVHLIFDSPSVTSMLDLHKNKGNSSVVKKVISKNIKSPFSNNDGPHSKTSLRPTFPEPKTPSTPKRLNEDCTKEEVKGESEAVLISPSIGTAGGIEEKENSTDGRKLQSESIKICSPISLKMTSGKVDAGTSTDCGREDQDMEYKAVPSLSSFEQPQGKKGTEGMPNYCEKTIQNSEESQDSASLKLIKLNMSQGGPDVTQPFECEGQENNPLVDVIDFVEGTEKKSAEGIPGKKCQAIRLAYKLRGQWLAWKLAGLFLDGATSQISGYGYAKLSPYAPYSDNQ